MNKRGSFSNVCGGDGGCLWFILGRLEWNWGSNGSGEGSVTSEWGIRGIWELLADACGSEQIRLWIRTGLLVDQDRSACGSGQIRLWIRTDPLVDQDGSACGSGRVCLWIRTDPLVDQDRSGCGSE
ncbi:hypothetical protein AV530_004394 [Patagioenas fasciata monilis]|uniref:Uncharacterized protein n=1 Tax=Patagioenas fasciata monilis TaxID=372326 RepID=A0A1V4J106_PATFA|nr:hypothetical protein AV530_004394 [Patagioenas fasciata monilis]